MLSQVYMLPSVKIQWEAMAEDARAVLEYAFSDALKIPFKVTKYEVYTRNIGGITLELHNFSIGYASFDVGITPCGACILFRMALNDNFPLYPLSA